VKDLKTSPLVSSRKSALIVMLHTALPARAIF